MDNTIPAINDTMYQSSICVAYIFSVLLLPNYAMTWMKNLSVVFCMIGVGLIGFGTSGQSDKNAHNTWYGYVELFISLTGYGLLEVYIAIVGKKHFSNDNDSKLDKVNSKLFMEAMIGFLCFFTLWPGILILTWTEIETFQLPKSKADILSIVIPAIMDTLYAGAFIVGIAMTNPVFMAVAQLLVIPVGFMYDVMFNGLTITFFGVFGTLFILIGFLMMELPIKKYFNSIINKNKNKSLSEEFSINH